MNYKEEFESLKFCDLKLKRAFFHSLVKALFSVNEELIRTKLLLPDNKIKLLELSNDLLHNIYVNSNLNVITSEVVEDTENKINAHLGLQNQYSSFLTTALKNSFANLNSLELSWKYELDIEPSNRYTTIDCLIPFDLYKESKSLDRNRYEKISDEEFLNLKQEFETVIRDVNQENILSVGLSYAHANVLLPKVYDIIFDVDNPKRFWKKKTIIRCAFNYKDIFHMDLWKGHSSHCLIEIIGEKPEIFEELNDVSVKRDKFFAGIGFCSEYDWNYIREN